MIELKSFSDDIKKDIVEFFIEVQNEQIRFITDHAQKLIEWIAAYSSGELSQAQFEALVRARERNIRQNINTLEISARAKAEKILFGIIDIIKSKILV